MAPQTAPKDTASDSDGTADVVARPRPANLLLREYYARLDSKQAAAGPSVAGGSGSGGGGAAGALGSATPSSAQQPQQQSPTSAASDFATTQFDVPVYVKGVLTAERTVAGLLRKDAELVAMIRSIGGERKTLVYENYHKLINASDTIRSMRKNVDSIEREVSLLSTQVQDITSLAADLHSSFAAKKRSVCSLKASTSLLRRLNFLSALPLRLARSAVDGSYLRSILFYALTRPTLERYRHVSLFEKAASDCLLAVAHIRSLTLQKLRGEITYPILVESIKVLNAISQDNPSAILSYYFETCRRIVERNLREGADWLSIADAVIADYPKLFRPAEVTGVIPVDDSSHTITLPLAGAAFGDQAAAQTALASNASGPRKKDPLALYLPEAEFTATKSRANSFVESCFLSWERSIKSESFIQKLDAHLELRKKLPAVVEIAGIIRMLSTNALDASFCAEMDSMVSESSVAVQNALAVSPEAATAAMLAELSNLNSSLATLNARLAGDSQSEHLVTVLPDFIAAIFILTPPPELENRNIKEAPFSASNEDGRNAQNLQDGHRLDEVLANSQSFYICVLNAIEVACRILRRKFDTEIETSFTGARRKNSSPRISSAALMSPADPEASQALILKVRQIAQEAAFANLALFVNSRGRRFAEKIITHIMSLELLNSANARSPSAFWIAFAADFRKLGEDVTTLFPDIRTSSALGAEKQNHNANSGVSSAAGQNFISSSLTHAVKSEDDEMESPSRHRPQPYAQQCMGSASTQLGTARSMQATRRHSVGFMRRPSDSMLTGHAAFNFKRKRALHSGGKANSGSSTGGSGGGSNPAGVNSSSGNISGGINNLQSSRRLPILLHGDGAIHGHSNEINNRQSSMQNEPSSPEAIFNEKTGYYMCPRPAYDDFTMYPVVTMILRIALHAWSEVIRVKTVGKNGFQQTQIDVAYCRQHLGVLVCDTVTDALLEEVVMSAYRRCLDAVFLTPEALTSILNSPETIMDENTK